MTSLITEENFEITLLLPHPYVVTLENLSWQLISIIIDEIVEYIYSEKIEYDLKGSLM